MPKVDQRWKDANWAVTDEAGNMYASGAKIALLMDIRDELKKLNAVFACPNFLQMPRSLANIDAKVRSVETRLRTISRKIPTRKRVPK